MSSNASDLVTFQDSFIELYAYSVGTTSQIQWLTELMVLGSGMV